MSKAGDHHDDDDDVHVGNNNIDLDKGVVTKKATKLPVTQPWAARKPKSLPNDADIVIFIPSQEPLASH